MKAVVVTSVRGADGSVRTGYALCGEHLAARQLNDTIAVKDGANTSLFECDDCKREEA